ncbi:hypothetical protein KKH23_10640, partial [Patescibacteria group bacterium]|nr:hypothetical protein [Patescibacteria group bacterium]
MPLLPSFDNIPPEITEKYSVQDNTFILQAKTDIEDRIEVEVGDLKISSDFLPQVKVKRWDNEVNFSVRLKDSEVSVPVVSFDGEKIVWEKDNVVAKLYDLTEGEGGYEFEIDLKSKPITNKIEFTLNTKGLKFSYQGPLTEEYESGYSERFKKEIIVTETQVKDLDGKVLSERPENVVGSYVAYHSTKGPTNNVAGGKLYRSGKFGHIYRPKIVDSLGKEVWGVLSIDKTAGILSVEIPQDFLDNAVYPVRHAAGLTIGYNTLGGSNENQTDRYIIHRGTPTGDGTVSTMHVGIESGTSTNLKGAFYNRGSVISNVVTYDFEGDSSSPPTDFEHYGTGTLTRTIDGTVYKSGTKSWKVVASEASDGGIINSTDFEFLNLRMYVSSCWIKTGADVTNAHFVVRGTGNTDIVDLHQEDADTDWTFFESVFTSSADAESKFFEFLVGLGSYGSTSDGTAWFDLLKVDNI